MFEYTVVPWSISDDGTATVGILNRLGAEGWEAVGLAPRSWDEPMAGMGAMVVSEVVVLLKRRLRGG